MNPIQDVQKIPFYVSEFDAAGNQAMDAGDSAAVAIDDATDATLAIDAAVDPAKVPSGLDPAKVLVTGFVVAGKKIGIATITATFAHTDGTPVPPPITSQVQIVSGPPALGQIGFGAPVAQ